MSQRKHNAPPTHDFALDHPAVKVQVAFMDRLKQAAVHDARSAVQRFTSNEPWRYFPSRLRKCPRDCKLLVGVFQVAYREAIASRLAQLNRTDTKLWRMCPDWPRHTAEELCEIPPYNPAEI